MTDLGIGIIGAGYMARTFAECLAKYTQGGRLRAVAGGTRAPATAAEFDVPALGSVEELIERRDVDVVIVTSPHADHRDQVITAARAHKHVFLEKPMEVSVARCDEMIQACDRAGVTLCLAHVLRWRGSPRRGKEVIDAGRIGRVQIIDFTWRDVRRSTEEKAWILDPVHGGFLLDAGVHVFDLMRWYAAADASRVFATITRFSDTPTIAPTAMVHVQFANGLWVSSAAASSCLRRAFASRCNVSRWSARMASSRSTRMGKSTRRLAGHGRRSGSSPPSTSP